MTFATTGRRVLITGGTGSFGSRWCAGCSHGGVGEVRVLSRDEGEAGRHARDSATRGSASTSATSATTTGVEASRGVDYVFHAAALKQVPSCEFFPLEAVRTNVHRQRQRRSRPRARNGVRSVVCLSTDKAVYPVNAMGMSKAMMEKVAQAFARNNPTARRRCLRCAYGNVMYSRGSVIPLFVEQIRPGEPLTVTDPAMTRFLMSLDESVELVEYAFEHAAAR